jgi:hypothetical protein
MANLTFTMTSLLGSPYFPQASDIDWADVDWTSDTVASPMVEYSVRSSQIVSVEPVTQRVYLYDDPTSPQAQAEYAECLAYGLAVLHARNTEEI